MIADFAETYQIYDYKQFPATYIAILAKELNLNSRIKRSFAGVEVSEDYLLQTLIYDRLNMLLWIQTEDGAKGKNKPVSLYEQLTIKPVSKEETQGFDSGEEFEKRRLELLTFIKKGGKVID